jgi:hypothetical protein
VNETLILQAIQKLIYHDLYKHSLGRRIVLSYCWKCGAKLTEQDRFCPVCGAAKAKVVKEEFTVSSSDLIEKVRQLLHEGNVTRIIVKDERDRTLLEIPATIGLIGALLAPWLAALGAITALATNCKIIVEKRE